MRTGDTVYHRPSMETWVVAAVWERDGTMAWCGWPPGRAQIADCDLVTACSDAEHRALLHHLAKIYGEDARGSYARARLEEVPHAPGE
mgnify:CR=1 FL=1